MLFRSNVEIDLYNPSFLVSNLGQHKYFSMNTYHMVNRKRNTIEFRIMDESSCLNYFDSKNYILLLLHFIDCCLKKGMPKKYDATNSFTGYAWLDADEFIQFLKLDDDSNLSEGLKEVKFWLYIRLQQNIHEITNGIFSYDCKSSINNSLQQNFTNKCAFFNCDFLMQLIFRINVTLTITP